MASKKRDYKKEYARRKELGKKRGLSTAQASGHARKKYGESSVKELREAGNVSVKERIEEQIKKYYNVVNRVVKGESLTSATKHEHLSSKTFNKLNSEYGNYLGKTYKVSPTGGKAVHSGYTLGNVAEWAILVDMGEGKFELKYVQVVRVESSHIGTYWNLVDNALHGNTSSLKSFRYNPIHDVHGNTYTLVTDANTIYAWRRSISSEDERDFATRLYRAAKVAA